MAGGGTGAMVFSQIFHWLIQAYLWHGALLITSALVLNCCVLGYVFFPVRRQPIPTVFPLTAKTAKGDMTIYAKSPEQKQLVDVSLFKDYCFVLFFVNSFLFCYGSTAVFFLLADYAIDCHIEKDSAALLLSITGLSSASGRFVMAGLMHCLRCLSALSLYIMAAFICGLAVVLMPAGETFPSFAILCSIFGFTYGGMCSASPVVASELFGAHRLTTVYSYLLVASGIGCLLGSPVAGRLCDFGIIIIKNNNIINICSSFSDIHSNDKSVDDDDEVFNLQECQKELIPSPWCLISNHLRSINIPNFCGISFYKTLSIWVDGFNPMFSERIITLMFWGCLCVDMNDLERKLCWKRPRRRNRRVDVPPEIKIYVQCLVGLHSFQVFDRSRSGTSGALRPMLQKYLGQLAADFCKFILRFCRNLARFQVRTQL